LISRIAIEARLNIRNELEIVAKSFMRNYCIVSAFETQKLLFVANTEVVARFSSLETSAFELKL